MTADTAAQQRAWRAAAAVTDPELPVLTLADLGVLRDVRCADDGAVEVTITPTYTGCPALAAIRAELRRALARAGFHSVAIRTALTPPWSSDWISEHGRRKLAQYGIAPPGPAPRGGPVPLRLNPGPPTAHCPHCGSADTTMLSMFGATLCTSAHQCRCCKEPFARVKEI
ncbi:1,2-phenylacetyl-CoA epoxidase subunit PaaD [Mycobacterium botniense]|uniref:Putative phenylacetic acid degradation protein PaaD/phenylacetate-CoA oxygenase, PaaJ subunit n=1 Tax=Mycobacterium botniense TaxID=84962 RepID=A0A7I9XUM6_9MYCO|nr:1,2-phenylacetyl-CoA epoxidase subunit PaaD [Mycobacterium botniense]GFG73200.1 putative phenylacetic acid degradation protein PaaD/phenylacetate-CoA oxygenase, PaaJ subunit [Mycobacterium botniense]